VAATKKVVFVQGGKLDEQAFPWMFFHFDPDTDVDPGPVELVFFDFPDGKRKTWKSWTMKRGTAAPPNPDSEDVLSPMVQIHQADGKLGPTRPSVLAFYDWVKAQPAGSILSLQIFSHGWMGGPILWNSWELGPNGEDIRNDWTLPRDPNDTEFRMRDFFAGNPLGGAEGRKFGAAFAPGAFIKLWGCVAPEGLRASVQRYKLAPKNDAEKAANQALLLTYLDQLENCFALLMARTLGLSVWASPLGWGSDPHAQVPISYVAGKPKTIDTTYRGTFPPDFGPRKRDRWWRVSYFFRHQDRGVEYYTQVLKARVDKTDYVEFKASWFDDARRLATASLAPRPADAVASPRALQQRLVNRMARLGAPETEQP
jgi:hypothetical protein